MTVIIENTKKLSGSPSRLPVFMAFSSLPNRAKSPKFNSSAEKYATISIAALAMTPTVAALDEAGGLSCSARLENPAW